MGRSSWIGAHLWLRNAKALEQLWVLDGQLNDLQTCPDFSTTWSKCPRTTFDTRSINITIAVLQ